MIQGGGCVVDGQAAELHRSLYGGEEVHGGKQGLPRGHLATVFNHITVTLALDCFRGG